MCSSDLVRCREAFNACNWGPFDQTKSLYENRGMLAQVIASATDPAARRRFSRLSGRISRDEDDVDLKAALCVLCRYVYSKWGMLYGPKGGVRMPQEVRDDLKGALASAADAWATEEEVETEEEEEMGMDEGVVEVYEDEDVVEVYEVDRLVGRRKLAGRDAFDYRVQWKAYPGEDSWEPEGTLLRMVPTLVKAYNQAHME